MKINNNPQKENFVRINQCCGSVRNVEKKNFNRLTVKNLVGRINSILALCQKEPIEDIHHNCLIVYNI